VLFRSPAKDAKGAVQAEHSLEPAACPLGNLVLALILAFTTASSALIATALRLRPMLLGSGYLPLGAFLGPIDGLGMLVRFGERPTRIRRVGGIRPPRLEFL
jgi:hypothetical protein